MDGVTSSISYQEDDGDYDDMILGELDQTVATHQAHEVPTWIPILLKTRSW